MYFFCHFKFELGWNYRMTNLQAAIGLAQVEKLDFHVKRKREIGNKYLSLLNSLFGVQLPLKFTSYADNIFQFLLNVFSDFANNPTYIHTSNAEKKTCTSLKFHYNPDFYTL